MTVNTLDSGATTHFGSFFNNPAKGEITGEPVFIIAPERPRTRKNAALPFGPGGH